MSLAIVIALNAVLDVAVIGAVAWLMLVPRRLDRVTVEASVTPLTQPAELSRAA